MINTKSATKINTSQPSLWDTLDAQDTGQQELIETLSAWAVLNAYPELATVGVKSGRSNWAIESWDLPRMETVYQAADLFSRRHLAYFSLSHWAIMHAHPSIVYRVGDKTELIEAGLTSWVAWCKDASLEKLRLVLETVSDEGARQ